MYAINSCVSNIFTSCTLRVVKTPKLGVKTREPHVTNRESREKSHESKADAFDRFGSLSIDALDKIERD